MKDQANAQKTNQLGHSVYICLAAFPSLLSVLRIPILKSPTTNTILEYMTLTVLLYVKGANVIMSTSSLHNF